MHSLPQRRKFIKKSLTLTFSLPAISSLAGPWPRDIPGGIESNPLPPELVKQFVVAAHGNLEKVKEMLAKEPMLANACWDWGGGDFEVALGGPSHLGNRDIANYLLDNNARIDTFCAAMLGERAILESLLKFKPGIANVLGPHKFPLLYHVAICGDIGIAEMVKPYIDINQLTPDCNLSVQSAARAGHDTIVEWLLVNGANDPNTIDALGKSPLEMAEERGFTKVVAVLRKYGAR